MVKCYRVGYSNLILELISLALWHIKLCHVVALLKPLVCDKVRLSMTELLDKRTKLIGLSKCFSLLNEICIIVA